MASILLWRYEAENAPLPPVCAKCGSPAETGVVKNLSWFPRWIYLLLLVNLIIFAIVALAMRKQARVPIPLCRRHLDLWTRFKWIAGTGWLVPAAIAVLMCSGLDQSGLRGQRDEMFAWACGAISVSFVAYLIVVVALASKWTVAAGEISDTQVTLTNVSHEFCMAVEQWRPTAGAGVPFTAGGVPVAYQVGNAGKVGGPGAPGMPGWGPPGGAGPYFGGPPYAGPPYPTAGAGSPPGASPWQEPMPTGAPSQAWPPTGNTGTLQPPPSWGGPPPGSPVSPPVPPPFPQWPGEATAKGPFDQPPAPRGGMEFDKPSDDQRR